MRSSGRPGARDAGQPKGTSPQRNGDLLTVWGDKRIDREATEGRWRVVQCAYGSFRRSVALPVSVKADKTQASYRDGVLRIELPKSDEARARRVAVQTG